MPFSLLDIKEHNSELLRLLTMHLPDMLWVKDAEGKYLYANKALCDGLLMAKNVEEPLGKGDVFFALREREAHKDKPHWHTFGELCFNSDQEVVNNNKPMKFEEYGNVKGKLLYLEVYKAPFYDKDGKIIGTVGAGRDITQLKTSQIALEKSLLDVDAQKSKLHHQVYYDTLTKLPNRYSFLKTLQKTLLQKRNKEKLVVLFIDLDSFKEINDSLGHVVGDKVLVEVTARMQTLMQENDTLARLGGDEFGIILNDSSDRKSVGLTIDTIIKVLNAPIKIANTTLHTSMSIGASIYPDDGEDSTTLLKSADSVMYQAKEEGRNRYSFYTKQMTDKALERVFLETALHEALNKDEFVVYFQPQVDANDARLVGMEVLVRWMHPEFGIISPDKFIPLAELTGMIVELDRIVLTKALSAYKAWHEAGLNPGGLSINLAMKQMESNDFLDFLQEKIGKDTYLYEYLEFEVTESQIMNNPEQSINILNAMHRLGISIAIDDFGTGYSSLAYLKKLPINKLKIDKSFVDNVPQDLEDAAICKTIISLCENLQLKVIAEGIESKEQQEFMLENGCDLIQGYFYSKPLSVDEMTLYLKER